MLQKNIQSAHLVSFGYKTLEEPVEKMRMWAGGELVEGGDTAGTMGNTGHRVMVCQAGQDTA